MVLKTVSTSLVTRPCASVYGCISAETASPTRMVPLPSWMLKSTGAS